MTAYLSGLLDSMNGADLVACGILALIALGPVLWALVTWAPILWQWLKVHASRVRSAFARWHSRQIRRANVPQEFPPDPVEWAPLLVILPLIALVVAIIRCNGVAP